MANLSFLFEEWKQTISFPNYAVSNTGKVKNIKTGRILKTYIDKLNYETIRLYKKDMTRSGVFIHRLIALAYIPNEHNKKHVNHIDGNSRNNCISNLEWCTCKENIRHSRHITRNGAVISLKKIKQLYRQSGNISLKEFISIIDINCF